MWTPRRLLLFVLGFVVCFGAYQVYSFFLGHYDGLPPLPLEYRYGNSSQAKSDTDAGYREKTHEIAILLQRAFGPKCPELNRSRNIEIGKPENKTVFAFDEWSLEDGLLRMTKVSLANFKTIPPDGINLAREEILTLQGEVAVIKFNQAVKSLFEIKPSVKPVAGHIEGETIKLTHNHGTPDRKDDITVYCKQRIDFVDEQKRIWCDGHVLVVYAEPLEAKFEGTGLEIVLANELVSKLNEKTKAKADKQDNAMSLTSVKSVRLERDVEFSFFKLQGSLLGGTVGKPEDNSSSGLPPQPMIVRCKDAFTYDVQNNVATFLTNVNAQRHRSVASATGAKQQWDELDADEKLTLELKPPSNKEQTVKTLNEGVNQFELKKAVATGKTVKITANQDDQGNGLYAEGIELICDNVAHEARLRGKDQVIARLKDYDIIAQGTVKILLPESDAQDKDPRGLSINGPGEVKLRATPSHPDPYTLASWQRELQWHRTPEEHRIELYGSAVFMHEKHGQMKGEQVKAWLVPNKKKTTSTVKEPVNPDRLDARLKRVEVDQKVSILSPRLVIPQANRLVLNITDAPDGFVLEKSNDPFDTRPAAGENNPSSSLIGKPDPKASSQQPTSPPLYLHANEIDADILNINEKQQTLRRLEARENVHIERRAEPGKQNGIDIHAQRLEMSLQGNTELYRIKLFGNKATLNNEKFGIEGQQIDFDQTENSITIPGPGKFRFMTDKDFQGRALPKFEQVNILWDERMRFGGRVAEFTGSVVVEKSDISLSSHSLTITLDRTMSLSGKDDSNKEAVGLESVICISNTQQGAGRVNPVVIEQRIKPGSPDRYILRIEGVQAAFDNSNKGQEILKVYGPGELNMVRVGKKQMLNLDGNGQGNQIGAASQQQQLKLTRVIFEQEMEGYRKDGILRFWKNVRSFHLPGDDVGMPLDEKKLPKDALYIACDKLELFANPGTNNSTLQEAIADGNAEVRANATSYLKSDKVTYSEAKGQVVMEGKGGNDSLYYNQERPGAPYQFQRAKAFVYDLKTGELRIIDAKSLQFK